ncbi:MAG: signal peptidase II [Chloroflexota bacterium]
MNLDAPGEVPTAGSAVDDTRLASRKGTARTGAHWLVFAGVAVAVLVVDQLTKAWLVANVSPGEVVHVIGDYARLVFSRNSGALFGLFRDNAILFGIVSLVVVGLIVGYHAKAGRSRYLSIALGLLLGGAIGNLADRLRLGYVVDFVDLGIGDLRFFTFNVGDSAITLAILMLIAAAIFPALSDLTEVPSDG